MLHPQAMLCLARPRINVLRDDSPYTETPPLAAAARRGARYRSALVGRTSSGHGPRAGKVLTWPLTRNWSPSGRRGPCRWCSSPVRPWGCWAG
jgi:hypothetical protein